jgi:hypothetical protein
VIDLRPSSFDGNWAFPSQESIELTSTRIHCGSLRSKPFSMRLRVANIASAIHYGSLSMSQRS